PAIPTPRFDIFYKHDDLTRLLQSYAQALPPLVEVRSIGKSHEGRDIWVVIITSKATGGRHSAARACLTPPAGGLRPYPAGLDRPQARTPAPCASSAQEVCHRCRFISPPASDPG
ncbi:MAG: M14 family zinc carboxypeptidase, partial [Rubrivivax sp.]